MDWDSLRQGATFGVLDGLVKISAGMVVIVFVVRATLRWLRFPVRFMDDDQESDGRPAAGNEAADGNATAEPGRERSDRWIQTESMADDECGTRGPTSEPE